MEEPFLAIPARGGQKLLKMGGRDSSQVIVILFALANPRRDLGADEITVSAPDERVDLVEWPAQRVFVVWGTGKLPRCSSY